MPDGRKSITVVLASLLAVVISALAWSVGPMTPFASADPDLKTVQKQVAKLDRLAEAASERYNDAKVKLAETKMRLKALDSDLTRQQQVVNRLRSQVAAIVVDQYQATALSTTSQVVLSDDPDAFLDNLSAVSAYNDQRGQVLDEFATELDRLKLRKAAVKAEAKRLAGIEKKMRVEKAEITEKAARAQAILDRLNGPSRSRVYAEESGPALSANVAIPNVAASGRAAVAVKFALAQVGKAYGYGATGPNAYDCSGLTMRAWGTAGVSLPHSSNAQQGYGTRIPESQLQPGDLVFYYSPVSHVGMYIGNGMIVNALNPRSGVRISSLHSMPYSGAVRPG